MHHITHIQLSGDMTDSVWRIQPVCLCHKSERAMIYAKCGEQLLEIALREQYDDEGSRLLDFTFLLQRFCNFLLHCAWNCERWSGSLGCCLGWETLCIYDGLNSVECYFVLGGSRQRFTNKQ